MSTPNIVITLGGVELPGSANLIETTIPNDTDVQVLDGSLYTDFVNVLRSWQIGWKVLTKEEYDIIYAVFTAQYANRSYPLLQIPYYDISAPAKVSISTKDIHFDGSCIYDFSIQLREQHAFS